MNLDTAVRRARSLEVNGWPPGMTAEQVRSLAQECTQVIADHVSQGMEFEQISKAQEIVQRINAPAQEPLKSRFHARKR